MEEAFAEARIIIDHGLVVGSRATRAGVRAEGPLDGGSLAGDGHDVGDPCGVSGPLHAGRIRDAGGRFLPNEERRECGRQDTRQPGDRGPVVLGRGLRSGLRLGQCARRHRGLVPRGAGGTGQRRLRRAVLDAGTALGQVPLPGRVLRRLTGHRVGHDAREDQVRGLRSLRHRLRWSDLPDGGTLDLGRRLADRARHAGLRRLDGRPPLGKYDDDGRPVNIPGHNMPLAVLGVLILWIGWWGFNPGSTMAAIPDIADIALTTNLAAAAGVLGAMGMSYLYRRNVDVGMGGNGAIAALVAITAPCAFVAPWASIVIGFVAGIIMYATLVYVDKIGVDDPLGAIAAHGMGGIWGTLSCGLFTTPALAAVGEPGLFYGGGLYQLGIQALGILAAGGFVFIASLAVFATLKATIGIRVKPEQELDGLDIHEHGVFGYPDLVATDYPNGNGKISDPLEGVPEGTA